MTGPLPSELRPFVTLQDLQWDPRYGTERQHEILGDPPPQSSTKDLQGFFSLLQILTSPSNPIETRARDAIRDSLLEIIHDQVIEIVMGTLKGLGYADNQLER